MKPGERIKILRILSGFTQERLAELAAVNRASLVSWERGDYNLFGTPSPQAAVWEPNPPKVNKYISTYLQDIDSLFHSFCLENKITLCAHYSADNGKLLFLGNSDSPLKYLLFLKPLFYGRLSAALEGLTIKVIAGFEGYPPPTLRFLESETIESLSLYFRVAQSGGLSIDTDAISTAFLKTKKVRCSIAEEDTKSLIRNAFLHFQSVYQDFEVPEEWRPGVIDPYSDCSALLGILSSIFIRLYEEITEKSLVWRGELDKDLEGMIRNFLKRQGFKERSNKIEA